MKAALYVAAALGAASTLWSAPATSQAGDAAQERVRKLVVYGRDPCPRGTGDEIVVCARRPETERYRIPKELRDSATEDDPESLSWAARAESIEYVGRTGIQSCSTVGPGGVSGCWDQMVRAWREDRRRDSDAPGQ